MLNFTNLSRKRALGDCAHAAPSSTALRFVRALIAAVSLGFVAVGALADEPALDVFGQPAVVASSAPAGDSRSTGATGQRAMQSASTREAPPRMIHWPEPVRVVLAAGIVWQGELNARIEDAASELHQHTSSRAWLVLLLMSFAYGVLHALGPGHGKLVVGTWLGSRDARITHALLLSGWTAMIQALSAIVLVMGAAWLASTGMSAVISHAASLEVVSYGLLCVAGLWALRSALSRADCCASPSDFRLVSAADVGSRDESSDHESAYLGSRLSAMRGRGSAFGRTGNARGGSFGQIFATGLAAGMRPCVGAIFVLVASVAARAAWIGIASAFAMAAGVAITVSLVGLIGLGANRLIVARSPRSRVRIQVMRRSLAVAGALVITIFAASQMILLLAGYLEPSLT